MTNLSKVKDPDKYYNWYQGYTQIQYPYYNIGSNQLRYIVSTSVTSGNISTKHFGDKFETNKVDGDICIVIQVNVPPSVVSDINTTLMFNIKKRTMKEVSDNDQTSFDYNDIDADLTHWSKNVIGRSYSYRIELDRKVSADDINNMDLDMMPGFRLTWNYNKHVEPETGYGSRTVTKQFVRYNLLKELTLKF